MRATEALTLEACLLALSRYDDSLPAHLSAQIQTVGPKLITEQTAAIQKFRDLILGYPPLVPFYESARSQLSAQYNEQERAKSSLSAATLTNGSAILSSPLSLIDIAAHMLNGPDFRTNIQRLVSRPQWHKSLKGSDQTLIDFAETLQAAATQLPHSKVMILRRLDQDIFSIQNLAYVLEIPLERAQNLVKSLWNERYIRPTADSFWEQLWLSWQGAPPLQDLPKPNEELTLTTKGYFYLHPGTLFKNRAA
jgi:inorganic triphosphatase YgiF